MVEHLKNFPENGTALILNFKKGELSEYLFELMRSGEINKGNFIVTGPFNRYAWQKAHDFCNNVKNYLGKTGTYYKEDYKEIPTKLIPKVDLLVTEHSSVDNAVAAINLYSTVLNMPSTMAVKLPALYHEEFQYKFNEIYPKLKVTTEGNFSYINYRVDKKIQPNKVTREKNTQMT